MLDSACMVLLGKGRVTSAHRTPQRGLLSLQDTAQARRRFVLFGALYVWSFDWLSCCKIASCDIAEQIFFVQAATQVCGTSSWFSMCSIAVIDEDCYMGSG